MRTPRVVLLERRGEVGEKERVRVCWVWMGGQGCFGEWREREYE